MAGPIISVSHEEQVVNAQLQNLRILEDVMQDLKEELRQMPPEAWRDEELAKQRMILHKQIKEISSAMSKGVSVAFNHIAQAKNHALKELILTKIRERGMPSNFNSLPMAKISE